VKHYGKKHLSTSNGKYSTWSRLMSSVSVIIPTYNGGEHLLDAVNSVLQQTYAPLEIIVVDDGSQEDILRILSPVSQRIMYIRQDNAGPAAARNSGIRAARGEFIAFLDDDDLWHPTKIEAQMRGMSQDPYCGLVYSFPLRIDENGSIIPIQLPETCPSGYVYYDFLRYNRIHTPSVTLLRATVFDKVGMFDESNECISCEDYDLWLRIAQKYKLIFCSDARIYYRQTASGISNNNYNHLRAYLYVYNKIVEQFISCGMPDDRSFIDAIGENVCNTYRRFAYKVYYENNDRIIARHLLAAVLRKDPCDLKSIVYLILFSLPEAWFEYARNLKRVLSGSKETSKVHRGDAEIADKTRS
jgi:glycosyltransferase involved in cell wall biosynthesis